MPFAWLVSFPGPCASDPQSRQYPVHTAGISNMTSSYGLVNGFIILTFSFDGSFFFKDSLLLVTELQGVFERKGDFFGRLSVDFTTAVGLLLFCESGFKTIIDFCIHS